MLLWLNQMTMRRGKSWRPQQKHIHLLIDCGRCTWLRQTKQNCRQGFIRCQRGNGQDKRVNPTDSPPSAHTDCKLSSICRYAQNCSKPCKNKPSETTSRHHQMRVVLQLSHWGIGVPRVALGWIHLGSFLFHSSLFLSSQFNSEDQWDVEENRACR